MATDQTLEGRLACLRLLKRMLVNQPGFGQCTLWMGNEDTPYLSVMVGPGDGHINLTFTMPKEGGLDLSISVVWANKGVESLTLGDIKLAIGLAPIITEIMVDITKALVLWEGQLHFSVSVFGEAEKSTVNIRSLLLEYMNTFIGG